MKFIIFDIDGTLTNTKNIDDKCFIKAFQTIFSLDISNENWSKLKNVTDWGITEEIIQREFNREPTPEEFDLMLNEHVRLLIEAKTKEPNEFEIVKGADTFLRQVLIRSDFKIGIATGAWERSARLKLAPFDLDLEKISFSNSNKHKSREAITQDVIKQLTDKHGSPDEVIYFGDGEWDHRTCKNLGIRFIGIDCNQNRKLKALGAAPIFEDYSDQASIIKIF